MDSSSEELLPLTHGSIMRVTTLPPVHSGLTQPTPDHVRLDTTSQREELPIPQLNGEPPMLSPVLLPLPTLSVHVLRQSVITDSVVPSYSPFQATGTFRRVYSPIRDRTATTGRHLRTVLHSPA